MPLLQRRASQGDDTAGKALEPQDEPQDAVLTPEKAQVVALARPQASAAALRRASTQSSSGGQSRGRTRSRGSSFASPLQRVEYVEVQAKLRRGGRSLYVVDVYLQRRSERQRLSDCAYSAPATSSFSKQALADLMRAERESDYRVEHRFSDFVELRARLQALVRHARPSACTDCRALEALAARKRYMALPLRRVFSTERARRELLAGFVNDALDMAARFSELIEDEEEEREAQDDDNHDERDGRSTDEGCAARAQAVALVDAFLRKPFESSLGII